MAKVNIKIEGIPYQVDAGLTILEAAKQCGRGRVPAVTSCVDFETMLEEAGKADIPIFCYEGEGTLPLGRLIRERTAAVGRKDLKISIVVGPEGGFSDSEVNAAKAHGLLPAGLGKRILRTETASGFVLSALVYEFELE